MKFLSALLAVFFTSASAHDAALTSTTSQELEFPDIQADSAFGMRLLSQARQLDQTAWMHTWVSGYSLKFQGCHHISQWNDEAEGEDDVRIATKRLVRFRLCPTEYCSADSSKGCSSGYGDYIIDMDTYLSAYFEAKSTYQGYKCEYLSNYVCGCDESDDKDGCLWQCYLDHNMQGICMQNPYGDDQQRDSFDLETYMSCSQAKLQNYAYNQNQNANNNNQNQNNYNNNNYQNGNYYIGPYCASQGGAIYLGVFVDDTCTTFADSNAGKTTFYTMTGMQLPYGNANIVDLDCLSCKEPSENNNGGNDNDDEDNVAEVCESLYTYAGKCESSLPYGTAYYPNNNACNYMEGIKIVRKDGTVVTAEAKANKTASVFIGFFVVAFVLLSAYVYYLKTKLDRASINLQE
jgi:hypothetical protein